MDDKITSWLAKTFYPAPKEKGASWFKKHPIWTVILVLVIIGFLFANTNLTKSSSKTNQQIETPTFNVNTEQLIQEFTSNEIRASEKYEDQLILISGTIYNVGQDWSGGNYVMLRDEYEYNGVQCFFNNKSELIGLNKGEHITLQGKVVLFTKGIIAVEDCSIVN